jgi:hypothetical protein
MPSSKRLSLVGGTVTEAALLPVNRSNPRTASFTGNSQWKQYRL